MSNSSRNFKLGIFIIGSILLLTAAVILLAGQRWGRIEYPAYTTFDESAQGLEIGSPVKFRGVPIGSVKQITIQDEDLRVRVDIALYEGTIQVENMTIIEFFQKNVPQGARCRLEITGITGIKYIDIGLFPPEEIEAVPVDETNDTVPLYIPSVPSLLEGVTANINYTLAEIAAIDFQSISNNIDRLLTTVNLYIEDEQVKVIAGHLEQTSRELARLTRQLSEANVGETMQKLKDTFDNLNALAAKMQKDISQAELAKLSQRVGKAVDEVAIAAASVRQFSDNVDQTVLKSEISITAAKTRETLDEMRVTLRYTGAKLNDTLEALTRVAELLEQDTGALLHGKQSPPVHMGVD